MVARSEAPSAGEPEATRLAEIQQKGLTIAQFYMGTVFQLAVLSLSVAPPGLCPMAGPNAAWGA